MSYLKDGQYRRVRDTDDGCAIYQCLWCHNTIEIRENPEWAKWCFCPKCGKSWFDRKRCRDRYTPRWAWDKYGDEIPHTVQLYPASSKQAYKWVFEQQTKWEDKDWGPWKFETYLVVREGELGHWRDALRVLRGLQAKVADCDCGIQYRYRVKLEKI